MPSAIIFADNESMKKTITNKGANKILDIVILFGTFILWTIISV